MVKMPYWTMNRGGLPAQSLYTHGSDSCRTINIRPGAQRLVLRHCASSAQSYECGDARHHLSTVSTASVPAK